MKTLAITFGVALTFIFATIAYSYIAASQSSVSVASPEEDWVKSIEARLASLSAEADVVDDLVFDAEGNIIMSATYKWQDNAKKGVNKYEYAYNNGSLSQVTSYVWADSE